MKKYYIYVLLDPSKPGSFVYDDFKFDYEPFYIGKGTGDRINNTKYDRNTFKSNKIKKIKKLGLEVISYKLFEDLENIESLDMEKSIISTIGRRDLKIGPLSNQTNGGDGRLTSPHSEETKLKISITKKSQNLHRNVTEDTKEYLRYINTGDRNPMFGKTHTYEVCEAHSILMSGVNHPMYNKKHSESAILKIKEYRKKSVDQDKQNRLSRERNIKPVLQYDLSGNFIGEHESIKTASKLLGLSESIIGKCCRGSIKNPRTFFFKFKNESSKVLNNSFFIKLDDSFEISGLMYKLIKRNKTSVVASIGNDLYTFRRKDHEFLFDKKSINYG